MKIHRTILYFSLFAFVVSCGSARMRRGRTDSAFKKMAQTYVHVISKTRDKTVAVLKFETLGGLEEERGRYAADRLTHALVNTGGVSVVERARIDRVIKEQEFSISGAASKEDVSRLGKLLSVGVIITGTVSKSQNGIEVMSRAINTESGLILKSVVSEIRTRKRGRGGRRYTSGNAFSGGIKASRAFASGPSVPEGEIGDDEAASGQLIDIKVRRKRRALYAYGRVKNTGKMILKSSVVTVSLQNRKGQQIGVIRCFSDRYILPGETLPFHGILIPFPRGYKKFKVIKTFDEDRYSHFVTNLKVSQLKLSRGGILKTYKLTGIIKNISDTTVSHPKVIASFFNKRGKFVGSAYGFASIKTLKRGQKSPFSISVYSNSLFGKPKKYKLHFSALEKN